MLKNMTKENLKIINYIFLIIFLFYVYPNFVATQFLYRFIASSLLHTLHTRLTALVSFSPHPTHPDHQRPDSH